MRILGGACGRAAGEGIKGASRGGGAMAGNVAWDGDLTHGGVSAGGSFRKVLKGMIGRGGA